jgi:spermidine/putrescine-binding protein
MKMEMDSTSWTTRRTTASSTMTMISHSTAKKAHWINMNCETPEDTHKFWIKEPEGCTNQGPEAALTMINHALRKEASALLSEDVQYSFNRNTSKCV